MLPFSALFSCAASLSLCVLYLLYQRTLPYLMRYASTFGFTFLALTSSPARLHSSRASCFFSFLFYSEVSLPSGRALSMAAFLAARGVSRPSRGALPLEDLFAW